MMLARFFGLPFAALALASTVAPARAEPLIVEHEMPLKIALEGAQAAIDFCLQGGYRIAVTVVDRGGNVRATLRADGANPHLLEGAMRKAYTASMLKITTVQMGQIIARSPGAAGLMEFDRMTALGGGLPIKVGEEVVGGIGVAGVPVGGAGGAGDEGCARAGLDRIVARLTPG
jgi:uncharacterized protein GlcG (DUF336 family)